VKKLLSTILVVMAFVTTTMAQHQESGQQTAGSGDVDQMIHVNQPVLDQKVGNDDGPDTATTIISKDQSGSQGLQGPVGPQGKSGIVYHVTTKTVRYLPTGVVTTQFLRQLLGEMEDRLRKQVSSLTIQSRAQLATLNGQLVILDNKTNKIVAEIDSLPSAAQIKKMAEEVSAENRQMLGIKPDEGRGSKTESSLGIGGTGTEMEILIIVLVVAGLAALFYLLLRRPVGKPAVSVAVAAATDTADIAAIRAALAQPNPENTRGNSTFFRQIVGGFVKQYSEWGGRVIHPDPDIIIPPRPVHAPLAAQAGQPAVNQPQRLIIEVQNARGGAAGQPNPNQPAGGGSNQGGRRRDNQPNPNPPAGQEPPANLYRVGFRQPEMACRKMTV
jgi:hypothetical protein